MKSITVKINIPKELRELLLRFYTSKELEKELKEECIEFLWDIYHANKKEKKKEKAA